MRTLLTILSFAIGIHVAQAAESLELPAKAKADILKRYPQAADFKVESETHFGNKLIEVSYKTDPAQEERNIELYLPNGRMFTNEVVMEGYEQMSPVVFDALKAQFGNFKIERGEMTANPNGIGEEYELDLLVDTARWRVSINDKGVISGKKAL